MKSFYISKLLTIVTVLLGWSGVSFAQTTTFNFVSGGAIQTYIVPSGVSYIAIDAQGAKGGTSFYSSGTGGCGGRVTTVMAVTAGQMYLVYVGGKGLDGTSGAGVKAGGYNGGGTGSTSSYAYCASGGGASDIRYGGTSLSNRILVAGGGGGGGAQYCNSETGGAGGGTVGGQGWVCNSPTYCPYYNSNGGSQSGGGQGGAGGSGGSGSLGIGGNSASSWYGGGGGGGYYGGGGGYYSGGAGGSSYPASMGGAFVSLSHTQGGNCGDGVVTITPDDGPPTGYKAFTYSGGSIQTWTVPTGVSYVNVEMAGAAGGNSYYTAGAGGCGGKVKCLLAVTAGQIYYIYLGGKGLDGITTSGTRAGGANGGGSGSTSSYPYCASGGGATDIRYGGTSTSNRIIVAGGGGGGGAQYCNRETGGNGGGLTGAIGVVCSNPSYCPYYNSAAGTQTGGGTGGAGGSGGNGSFGVGGSPTSYYGGGGGGGYYGGGGGYYSGGAGGSSYPATAGGAISVLSHTQGGNCGSDGYCALTPVTTLPSTFAYTGSVQTYTVPTGITILSVDAYGAAGGTSYYTGGTGGCGGSVSCKMAVTPGQILYVYTGGKGTDGQNATGSRAGGFNGGGSTYSSYRYSAGGGGASDIRTGGTATSDRVLVAGGGGGGGGNYCNTEVGGNGGGLTGGSGMVCNSLSYCPYYNSAGGTQTGGGTGGASGSGGNGSLAQGGNNTSYYGGGGGGGYYGGGGGYYAGGAGGSSYANPTTTSSVTSSQGGNCGQNGVIYISPICTAGSIVGVTSTCPGYTTTLTNLTAGGTWTSSNTAVATVNSSGVVLGITNGTATITYGGTLACGTVFTSKMVTVMSPPTAISGSSTICQSVTNLYTSSPGGYWTSSNTSLATIDAGGTAIGVATGSVNITYSISATCYVTTPATVQPTAPITGPITVCSGLTITLSDAIAGGTWTASNTNIASVNPGTGVVTGGITAGSQSISYTLSTGCTRIYSVTTNPLPAVFTGSTSVCLNLSTTLSESSTGGAWSSGSTTIAPVSQVNATTASVFGKSAGTTTITYTLPTGCIMTTPYTVNILPGPISAPAAGTCITSAGNPATTLTNPITPGTWTSSNTLIAQIGSSSGTVTSLVAGTTNITYTLSTGCLTSQVLVVNALPAAITGTKVFCGLRQTYLADASLGGVWSTSNAGVATVGSTTGIVTGIPASVPLTAIITYTMPTGCTGVTTVTVNPIPNPIVGVKSVCVGATTLLSDQGGGTWSTSNPGKAGISSTGLVTGISSGTASITYSLPVTLCFIDVPVTVNPVPAPITTASVTICSNQTTTLNTASTGGTWSSSTTAVANVNTSGLVTPASAGNVDIYYQFSNGCKSTTSLTINPLPNVYNLSVVGASSYCAGGTGVKLQLNNSTFGVTYKLYRNGVLVPSGTAIGDGTTNFSMGTQTAAGTYTATATSAAGGCVINMSGSPVIAIDPLPKQYTLLHSGTTGGYCSGGPGVDIYLDSSQLGIDYYLYSTSSPTPVVISGTGSGILDFSYKTNGTYTAIAKSAVGCTSPMLGSVVVTTNIPPADRKVTVGLDSGYYCEGTAGTHVILDSNGVIGVRYYLYNSSMSLVDSASGANSGLDFGIFPQGQYTATAKNILTGCTSNMSGIAYITKRDKPHAYSVTGTAGYCAGGSAMPIGLDSSDNFVSYQLLYNGTPTSDVARAGSFPSSITIASKIAGGIYTVIGTNTMTGCSGAMKSSAVITAYPALTIDTVKVSGNGSYCAGGPGVGIILVPSSQTGVKYELYSNGGALPIASLVGTGSALNFGLDTLAGVKTIKAISLSSGGCQAMMYGSPSVSINSLPDMKNLTVTNGGAYCAGGPGVNIGLDFSDNGVDYQLYRGISTVGTPVAGASSSIDFGIFTTSGSYTITGTNSLTGCKNTMNGVANVSANATPTVYNITGGGSYCVGSVTGKNVGLFNSSTGISYQLFLNGLSVGVARLGTGAPIDFGNYTGVGLYTVVATNTSTGCTANMSGSVVITTDPLPAAFDVTGGGDYCVGGTGFNVGLNNSVNGVRYQLNLAGIPVGTAVAGSGNALNFGLQTAGGAYTVVATTIITGCKNDMNGSAVINANPLPTVDTVKGGGAYCAGDAGSDVFMSGSVPGVNYQLYTGGVAVGTAVLGTGDVLDLGLQTTAGAYTAVATNAATGCTSNMSGLVAVNINPLPTAYAVTGGGTMCQGTTGFPIYVAGSKTGVTYELNLAGTSTGTNLSGTGAALTFPAQTGNGSYTVIATNTATGCTKQMAGAGSITVNPTPTPYTVAVENGGHYCITDTGVMVSLIGSETGVNYSLYNAAANTGLPVGGTGSAISFGLHKAAGNAYTVLATNTTTNCSANMANVISVTPDTMATPMVKINHDGNACVGDTILYTATPTNAGVSPTYVWKVGSSIVSIKDRFTNIPAIGDVVTVTMTSNATCTMGATSSDVVIMNVIPYVIPSAAVVTTPTNNVCQGTPVTMTATPVNDGIGGQYAWMKNGVFTGNIGKTFSYTPTAADNGDIITFMLRSSLRCRTADTVFSDPVVMTVDIAIIPSFEITAHQGPVTNVGQIDTFSVKFTTSPSYTMTYQWYVQNTPVPGATSSEYINKSVYNNDVIKCEVTKTGACGNQSATRTTTVKLKNLGTQQVVRVSDITVLPNPNKGEFTVKGTIATNDKEATVEITNMLGQSVYFNKVTTNNGTINERIKLSNTLANGMYLLNVRSGETTNVFHIVIEQ